MLEWFYLTSFPFVECQLLIVQTLTNALEMLPVIRHFLRARIQKEASNANVFLDWKMTQVTKRNASVRNISNFFTHLFSGRYSLCKIANSILRLVTGNLSGNIYIKQFLIIYLRSLWKFFWNNFQSLQARWLALGS